MFADEPALADVAAELPSPPASPEALAAAAVDLLRRGGPLPEGLWTALAAARPRRAAEIDLLRACFPGPPIPSLERLREVCAELDISPDAAPRVTGDAALHWLLLQLAARPDPSAALVRLRHACAGHDILPVLARALAAEDRAALIDEVPGVWIRATPTAGRYEACALDPERPARPTTHEVDVSDLHARGSMHLPGSVVVEFRWTAGRVRLLVSGTADSRLIGAAACIWRDARLLASRWLMPRSSDRAGDPGLLPYFDLELLPP